MNAHNINVTILMTVVFFSPGSLCVASPLSPVRPAHILADWPPQFRGGVADDYRFEASDFMKRTAYRNVAKLDDDDAPSGAYGPVNKAYDAGTSDRWFIEHQRFGGDLVDGGVAVGDTDAIARGLRIIRWGLKQEQSDGSFKCPDNFHSTAFFVEASAHALIMIAASPYASQFKDAGDMLSPLQKAAQWMARDDIRAANYASEAPYTHRNYMDGTAIGETGILCDDKNLVEVSRSFIKDGLKKQDPSGYNPEKGGYDSSYNALGTYYALRYYDIVATDELRKQMYPMLDRAIAWEASRVDKDGNVSTEGNTRVGGEGGEHDRTGKSKSVAIGQVFRSFYHWSMISGDTKYADLADLVARGNHMEE